MSNYNIDGRYACKANWVVLKRKEDKIIVRNCLIAEDFESDIRKARYLQKLDGKTNPLKVKGYSYEECVDYYMDLDSKFLIRKGRKLDFGSKMYTVYIPKKNSTGSIIPKILNFLLMVLCIPTFTYGLYCFTNGGICFTGSEHCLFGYIVGILLGMVLHEMAHVAACLAYGGRWFETGFMWNGIFPGAYCMVDGTTVKGKYRCLKQVQINLAGVEMNLLLAGISFLLIIYSKDSYFIQPWTGALFMAALQNIFLALLNMTFAEGLDGEHVISILLGNGSIVDHAKTTLKCMFKQKERRKYFKKRGINGVANICVCCTILLFQITTPMLILAEILYLIGVIFT